MPPNQPQAIPLAEVRQLLQDGAADLYDIREAHEYASGVIAGAKLLPMSQLNTNPDALPRNQEAPFILICYTQARSAQLAAILHQAGWEHCSFALGGIQQWQQQGWPLVPPPAS